MQISPAAVVRIISFEAERVVQLAVRNPDLMLQTKSEICVFLGETTNYGPRAGMSSSESENEVVVRLHTIEFLTVLSGYS